MSLITSCPACGTMFRVVPDQLKISEGWVRCGHCGEIFDASTNLSDESVLVEPELAQRATRPADVPKPPAEAPAKPAQPPSKVAQPPAKSAELPAAPSEPPRPAPPPPARAAPSNRSAEPSSFFGEEDSHAPLEPSPLDAPFVFRRSEIPRSELQDSDFVPVLPGRESELLPEEEFEDSTPEPLEDVSFVRQARREALWRRPGVRIALAVAGVLLALLLALQAAYQDRDRLALAQPGLRPSLERMCAVFGCTLGAPRQIEAVVIESSGFNRLRNDTYRLAFTLRNTAPVPVAVPAMELTITDAQDQTIARRVLTPREFGALADDTIPAASEWSRVAGVVLDTGGAARVAGYRLLAFYP
jgi:predicted Zn finger-like uncharacterized protein